MLLTAGGTNSSNPNMNNNNVSELIEYKNYYNI